LRKFKFFEFFWNYILVFFCFIIFLWLLIFRRRKRLFIKKNLIIRNHLQRKRLL
jgi:hypothetical protein